MFNLINVTSHPQDLSLWLEEARNLIYFPSDGEPVIKHPISPTHPLHPQVMRVWKDTLTEIDRAYAQSVIVSGIMIAGYAPLCLGIAAQARNFRIPVFVSVMKKVENPPEWAKSPFIPAGVRWCRPAPFRAAAPQRPVTPSALPGRLRVTHLAPRPCTPQRKELIENLGCAIVRSPVIHPPAPQGEPELESIGLRAKIAQEIFESSAVLLDGPPIEVALQVWSLCMEFGIPVYYLATEPAPAPLFSSPVAINLLPY